MRNFQFIRIGGIIPLLLASSIVWSQNVDFESVLRRSLAASPDLERQRLAMEIAALDITRARSAFLPRLDMNVDNNRIELLGNLSSVESLQLAGKKSGYIAQAGVKFGINLYNGGQDKARWDKAEEKLREAEMQWRRRRADVALQVLEKHHTFELAQIDWKVSKIRLVRVKQRLVQIQELVQLGQQAEFRLAEAELDVQDRELDLMRRERERSNAWKDLYSLSSQDSNITGPVSDKSIEDELPDSGAVKTNYLAVLPSLDFVPEMMIDEVDLASSRERSTSFDQRRARGRYGPTVDFFVKQDQVGLDLNNYDAAFRGLSNDKRYVGIAIRWNFFEGFDTWAEVNQSDLRTKSAYADLAYTRQEQERAIRDRDRLFSNAEAELSFERKRLIVLTRRVELERLRSEVGRSESGTFAQTESEFRIQQFEVMRREQILNYLRARRALSGDFKQG
jgi:outer membrane protein TolC